MEDSNYLFSKVSRADFGIGKLCAAGAAEINRSISSFIAGKRDFIRDCGRDLGSVINIFMRDEMLDCYDFAD